MSEQKKDFIVSQLPFEFHVLQKLICHRHFPYKDVNIMFDFGDGE